MNKLPPINVIVLPLYVVLVTALSYKLGPIIGPFIMLAMATGIVLLGHPRLLLATYWLWIALTPYLEAYIVKHRAFSLIDELLTLALIGVLITHHIFFRKRAIHCKTFVRLLAVFVFVCILSAAGNGSSAISLFRFLFMYTRPFVLFVYSIYFLDRQDIKPFIKLCLFVFGVQLILNTGWLLGISPLPVEKSYNDLAIGSLGNSCAYVAYFCIAIIITCASIISSKRLSGPHAFLAYAVGAAAMIQLYFTFTIHAILLLGICVVILPIIRKRYLRIISVFAVIMVTLIISTTTWESNTIGGFNTREKLKSRFIISKWKTFKVSAKFLAYNDTMFNAPSENRIPILGSGPGTMGSLCALQQATPLARKYFLYAYISSDSRISKEVGSIASSPNTGLLAIWTETGPFGFLSYWGLYIYIAAALFFSLKKIRKDFHNEALVLSMAEPLITFIVIIIVINSIDDGIGIKVLSGTWIWAGLLWSDIYQNPEALVESLNKESQETAQDS